MSDNTENLKQLDPVALVSLADRSDKVVDALCVRLSEAYEEASKWRLLYKLTEDQLKQMGIELITHDT